MEPTYKNTLARAEAAALRAESVDYHDAVALSRASGTDLADLFATATRVRERFHGDNVDICSIVNAKSGACGENCSFCAQSSRHSTGAPVYPLISVDQMGKAAESAKKNGAKRFCIVTSGRGIDSDEDLKNIAQGIGRVRDAGLSPCATLGALSKQQLAYLKSAGLHRYHHNIETSREFFPNICTSHTYDERITLLQQGRALGLSLCSGGILGMGESMEDRIRMALALREAEVDSVPLNFLMPIAGTPMEKVAAITPLEALLSIALFRLLLPSKQIRICGGRGTALRSLHPLIFMAGADGFLIGNYLTTTGPDPADDLRMLSDLGLQH